MKKLLFTLIVPAFFIIAACQSNNISEISTGVKVIGKCCKNISLQKKKTAGYSKGVSLLPANSWDAKMMIF